jgi:hypothetical protein
MSPEKKIKKRRDIEDASFFFCLRLTERQCCGNEAVMDERSTAFRPPVGAPLPTLVFAGLRRLKYVDGCRQRDIGTVLPSLVFAGLRQRTSRRRTLPKFVDSHRQTLVSPTLFRPLK